MVQRFDELDAERLRELFEELDAELDGRSEPVTVLVAGGAALAFKWSDRRTYDVDLIGGEFPADFRRAIATVADRNNLEWSWVNDGGTAGNAALEPRPQPLYVGENFAAYSPDARYLLAMKLFAARQRDLDDAIRLSTETGLTTGEVRQQIRRTKHRRSRHRAHVAVHMLLSTSGDAHRQPRLRLDGQARQAAGPQGLEGVLAEPAPRGPTLPFRARLIRESRNGDGP